MSHIEIKENEPYVYIWLNALGHRPRIQTPLTFKVGDVKKDYLEITRLLQMKVGKFEIGLNGQALATGASVSDLIENGDENIYLDVVKHK